MESLWNLLRKGDIANSSQPKGWVSLAKHGMTDVKSKDEMGDRMKSYEQATDIRLSRELPIIARLDGKGFSKWTRDLERPFDKRFHDVMADTAKFLAENTNAKAAYTQSDEITLGWVNEKEESQVWFDGRVLKMASVLSSMASAFFNAHHFWMPSILATPRPFAFFDCRVWSVPSLDEAANAFLWREFDCSKNAISQATRYYYSHNAMHGKNGQEMIAMLSDKGVCFDAYPCWARRGTYIVRKVVETTLSATEMEKIPVEHRPVGPVLRAKYLTCRPQDGLRKCANRVAVLFKGSEIIES